MSGINVSSQDDLEFSTFQINFKIDLLSTEICKKETVDEWFYTFTMKCTINLLTQLILILQKILLLLVLIFIANFKYFKLSKQQGMD